MQSKPLEQYLAALGTEMKGVPEASREEQLQEVHQHLSSLVEFHISNGMDRSEAETKAVGEFGPAPEIARGIRRVCLRARLGFTARWVATALAIWAGMVVATYACLLAFDAAFGKPVPGIDVLTDRFIVAMLLSIPALFAAHFHGRYGSGRGSKKGMA